MKTVFLYNVLLAVIGILSCHDHQNKKFILCVPAVNGSENLVDKLESNDFYSDLLPSRIYCLTQILNESFDDYSNRFKECCHIILKNINKNPSQQQIFNLKTFLKRISRDTKTTLTQDDKNNTTYNSNNYVSNIVIQNPNQSTKLESAQTQASKNLAVPYTADNQQNRSQKTTPEVIETHTVTAINILYTSDNQQNLSKKTTPEVTETQTVTNSNSPPLNSDQFTNSTTMISKSTKYIKQNNTNTEQISNEIPLTSFSSDQNTYSWYLIILLLVAVVLSFGILFAVYKMYRDRFNYTFHLGNIWHENEDTPV